MRLGAIPVFIVLLLQHRDGPSWRAGIIFGAAAITDQLDGYLPQYFGGSYPARTWAAIMSSEMEGLPVEHRINNNALLGKMDWSLSPANNLSASYNFNYSRNTNQTFDVATYGNSANGIEGPSRINVFNLNLFSTLSASRLN